MPSSLTIEDLRELIHSKEVQDPLVFLESIMSGQDPRRLSEVYQLAVDISDFSGIPNQDEWDELFEKIQQLTKYHIVSLTESTAAAKTLAEYLHSKKKSIETFEGKAQIDASAKPLTDDEIRSFLKIYEDEF